MVFLPLNTIVLMAELQERSRFSPKRTLLFFYSLLEAMWRNQEATGGMFCGQMKPK